MSRRGAGARHRDGFGRSIRLFRLFLREQTEPDAFYRTIADDAADLLGRHVELRDRVVADFGGGPGFYSAAFRERGASTIVVDSDPAELRLHGRLPVRAVVARAERAPLADESVDVAFSSNLLEHVGDFAAVANEMLRVVRPGGIAALSYTIWYGPWGGHETSPWHYLGGHRAARRYEARTGAPPKNLFGSSMFAASVKQGLDWLRTRPELEVLELRPRYLPPSFAFLVRVPVVRELLTWNLWLVVRKSRDRASAVNC